MEEKINLLLFCPSLTVLVPFLSEGWLQKYGGSLSRMDRLLSFDRNDLNEMHFGKEKITNLRRKYLLNSILTVNTLSQYKKDTFI